VIPAPDPALRPALEATAPEGDPEDVGEALVALATARPSSGWEMACAIEERAPGFLAEREGCLYPLLASLVRGKRLEARWIADDGAAPRRVYAAAGAAPGAGAADAGRGGAPDPSAGGAGPRLRRAAEAASRSVRDPFEREEARAEILSHLAAAAAARGAEGLAPDAAERAALRDLGDPWRVRSDFGRVDRGRAPLGFPRTLGERVRSVVLNEVIPIVVVVGLLVLVRWQVLQPYNIPTKSMEPTLHGDAEDPDYILVDKTAFRRRDIGRWDVAVFYPPPRNEGIPDPADPARAEEERQPYVKRCVGLGGESLDLRGGDAWVDGALARRPLEIEDAMMVPIYDLADDLRKAAGRARFGRLGFQLFGVNWGAAEGDEAPGWTLRGESLAAAPEGGAEARLAFRGSLTNAYVDARGHRTEFFDDAGDLELRMVVEAAGAGTVVGADLVEGKARHEFRAGPRGIEVRSGGRTWSSPHGALVPGRPVELRFRNVDDRLTVRVDGEVVLREVLPDRVSVPTDPEAGGVELVVERGPARLSGLRVLRDIVYLRWKDDGWPRRIPEGRLFMMGDNTGSSNDSRAWGPVDGGELIGRPFLVVWPPSRVRRVR
jgi:signal peptidase I